jgi:hypothetical protein
MRASPDPDVYHGDRCEALLWGSVHPIFDLVEGLREVPDG